MRLTLPCTRCYVLNCQFCACLYAANCPIFPVCASMRFTLYLPYACDCLLSLRMPPYILLSTFHARACMHFIVYFPCACLYSLYYLLSLCMHLCISLYACPMHVFYVFYCLLFLHMFLCITLSTFPVMPLCISLCAPPTHASMYFTLYLPHTSRMLLAFHSLLPYACLHAFYCLLSTRMPLCVARGSLLHVAGTSTPQANPRKCVPGSAVRMPAKW